MEISKKEVLQEKEIRFTGLSRSGNHAIIHWMIQQIKGSYTFLNCVEPKTNPYKTARPLDDNGTVFETNIKDFNLSLEQQAPFTPKSFLLYSHEDIFLSPLNHKDFKNNHDRWLGKSRERKDVLILRDPFNLFASRMKSGLMRGHYTHHGARPISTQTLIRIYKQHAREFLGIKNRLKDKVCINYNSWAATGQYRKSVATELDIPFSDRGFEKVTEVAGGSSFDGVAYSGQASTMKVNSRWKAFKSREDFWKLFDEELVELTEKIFGEIPPVKYWKNKNHLDLSISP